MRSVLLILLLNLISHIAFSYSERAALVVNRKSINSMQIADIYSVLRRIPQSNIVYVNPTMSTRTDFASFRDEILKPVMEQLQARGVWGHIDTIIYSSDFPTSIDMLPEFAGTPYPSGFRQYVSLTAVTYYYKSLLAGDPEPLYSYYSPSSHQTYYDSGVKARSFERNVNEDYLLSSILGVTTNKGNTIYDVQNALRRGFSAETNQQEGTIFFSDNGDIRANLRNHDFEEVAQRINAMGIPGVDAEIVTHIYPRNRRVLGATLGKAGYASQFEAYPETEILPGALIDNLTSFGGSFLDAHTNVAEWQRRGAGLATGTVVEPYAIRAKFPTAFVHWHYLKGLTLGEAVYQTTLAPMQLLVYGDPLLQPWSKRPKAHFITRHFATDRERFRVEVWSEEKGAWFIDGVREGELKAGNQVLVIDNTKLHSGRHELRLVPSRTDVTSDSNVTTKGLAVRNFVNSSAGIAFNREARRFQRIRQFKESLPVDPTTLVEGVTVKNLDGIRISTVYGGGWTNNAAHNQATISGYFVIDESVPTVYDAMPALLSEERIEQIKERNQLFRLFQFQFRTAGTRKLTFKINGQRVYSGTPKNEVFLPMNFYEGVYSFELEIDGTGFLDIITSDPTNGYSASGVLKTTAL